MARILVVDDEPAILTILDEVLRDEGYEVVVADDGVTALQVLAQTGVDLIITDTMMPRVSGLEVIRSARARPDVLDIPVILMSAAARPDLDGLGPVTFMAKPFDLTTLRHTVAKMLPYETDA
jgi:CheY-like chemotaxis protein